jgi:hypothetical protein
MGETSKQDLLRRAARLVGADTLAQALKVPQPLLEAWMDGHATVPARKLVALADYMEEITLPPKRDQRAK